MFVVAGLVIRQSAEDYYNSLDFTDCLWGPKHHMVCIIGL